jgi:SAM-dependent methyltransferase
VFTHIVEDSALHYLAECARILRPGGVLVSTWFLFDKRHFAMMQSFQNALYINVIDPTNAVIFDREWLKAACQNVGLEAKEVVPPTIRGYHWMIQLRKVVDPKTFDLPVDTAPLGSMPPPVPLTDPSSVE